MRRSFLQASSLARPRRTLRNLHLLLPRRIELLRGIPGWKPFISQRKINKMIEKDGNLSYRIKVYS